MLLEVIVILALAFFASLLTLFSGFGLGTLLLPAFALVFPLDVAIAATAVVHLANNLWKGLLLGRAADGPTVARFGVPAALAGVVGALALLALEGEPLASYHLGRLREITWLGVVVGSLIVVFALFDLVPALRHIAVSRRFLVLGGLLSGFFGGLSGHQGALRAAFLTKAGLDAKTFVATGVLCAILVDVARLTVYSSRYAEDAAAIGAAGGWGLLGGAMVTALAGALVGARLVGSVTIDGVRTLVAVLLLVIGPLLAFGLV